MHNSSHLSNITYKEIHMKMQHACSAIVLSVVSLNAHAGFFSSSDDFKCGREDALQAVQKSIKESASEILQSKYISSGRTSFYNKPVEEYQKEIDGLQVSFSNTSTSEQRSSSFMNCTSTISVKVPAASLNLSQELPHQFSLLKVGGASLLNGSLVWKNYSYQIKLADNKKDIIVGDMNSMPQAVYNTAWLSVNHDNILSDDLKNKLNNMRYSYADSDRELNDIWKSLPVSLRTSMKASQQEWVKLKAQKCGSLSEAQSEQGDLKAKIATYSCQIGMTEERINFLGGDRG